MELYRCSNLRRSATIQAVLVAVICVIFLSSCANYKDIPYFQNVAEVDLSQSAHHYEMTIKPKDQLSIYVFSSDAVAAALFNLEVIAPFDLQEKKVKTRALQTQQYIVDNNGEIVFPVVGKIKLAGLSIPQANEVIKSKITKYFRDEKDCLVNTYIDNYEVTVMGEVKNPQIFTTTRNKMTVLEALAKAGDMTIYGKRDCVKILREKADGEYEIHELDMRDANILNSPYYYLQQRDIVYVEPNEVMVEESKIGKTTRLWLRGIGITLSLGSLLYRVLE